VSIITGHYFNKHESGSPLVRLAVRRYRREIQRLVTRIHFDSALEVGSGEGYILSYIRLVRPDVYLVGSDITHQMVLVGRAQEKKARWCVARAENLPFVDQSFDLVLACEVLEHLTCPEAALMQARRVSRRFCIITTPNEPLWRLLNVVRGRYLRDGGNTPGHIQHWSARGISRLVSRYFQILHVSRVLPWTFVLARVR